MATSNTLGWRNSMGSHRSQTELSTHARTKADPGALPRRPQGKHWPGVLRDQGGIAPRFLSLPPARRALGVVSAATFILSVLLCGCSISRCPLGRAPEGSQGQGRWPHPQHLTRPGPGRGCLTPLSLPLSSRTLPSMHPQGNTHGHFLDHRLLPGHLGHHRWLRQPRALEGRRVQSVL